MFGANISSNTYNHTPDINKTGIDQGQRKYFEFEGWYLDRDYNTKYIFTTMPAENLTLYAHWILKDITVTFDTDGGTNVPSQTIKVTTTAEEPTIIPEKRGYEFSHWEYNGVPVDFTNRRFESDAVIKAIYTTYVEYQIKYVTDDSQDIVPIDNSKYRFGSHVVLGNIEEVNTTKKFVGWRLLNSSSLITYSPGTLFEIDDAEYANNDGEIYLKAIYEKITPVATSLTYNSNYPTGNNENIELDGLTQNEELFAASKETFNYAGYTIIGWNTEKDATTPLFIPGASFSVTGDIFTGEADNVLYAIWQANTDTKYVVEYYLEDLNKDTYTLTKSDEQTGTTDTTANAPILDFNGFTFDKDNKLNVLSGTIKGDGSLVLKVYYTRNINKVTYEYQGNVIPEGANELLPASHEYEYEEEVTIADKINIAGYTFTGWDFIQHDVEVKDNKFNMPNRDVKLIGKFTANNDTKYVVEYYLQNILLDVYDLSKTENFTGTTDSYEKANIITFDGFTFDSSNSLNKLDGYILGDGSLVLKVYYTRNSYQVSYEFEEKFDKAIPPVSSTHLYGSTVNVVDKINVAGYIFDGWHTIDDEIVDVTNNTKTFVMPDSNITLYGKFIAFDDVTYEIRYHLQNTNGDGYIEPSTDNGTIIVKDDGVTDQIVKAPILDFKGFTFDKDNINNKLEGIVTVSENGEGTLVLHLYYNRIKHKVYYSYYDNVPTGASSLPDSKEYYFESDVQIDDKASAKGYDFIGWDTLDESDLVITSNIFKMPNRDVYLHGKFIARTDTLYKVSYYYQKNGEYGKPLNTIERKAETDSLVSILDSDKIPALDNYVLDESMNKEYEGQVLGDGTLELKVYFKKLYKVVYNDGVKDEDIFEDKVFENLMYNDKTPLFGEDPVRSGYVFTGWEPLFNPVVTDDYYFEAVWKKCTPVISDPPVKKQIVGDTPTEEGTFVFTLKAIETTANVSEMPMPEGSENGVKTKTVHGAGEYEFGNIEFTMPGTYIYTIVENNENDEHYDYDNSKYTVTYVVTQNGDKLEVKRTITKDDVDAIDVVFTNTYYDFGIGEGENPQTGDNIYMYIALLVVSTIGIFKTSYILKKEYN